MLDSSTLIRVLRRKRDELITRRVAALQRGDAAIATVVRHELMFGAMREPDPARAVPHLRSFLADFSCLPVDERAADMAASIRTQLAAVGTPNRIHRGHAASGEGPSQRLRSRASPPTRIR